MRHLWLCVAIVIILFHACSSSGAEQLVESTTDQPSVSIVRSPTETKSIPTEVVSPTPAASLEEQQEQPTQIPYPTETPILSIPDTKQCIYASHFVEDITLPDDTILPTGQRVEKIWRIRNTGTCPWNEGTSIIHIKAHRFDLPVKIPVPLAQPGDEIDIRIVFTTPLDHGTFESFWRLQNTENQLFGGVLFFRFTTSNAHKSDLPTLPTYTSSSANFPITAQTRISTLVATPTPFSIPESNEIPTKNCVEYNPQFMGVLSQANLLGLDVGCALSSVAKATGIVQEYWYNFDSQEADQRLRSFLFIHNETGTIYVLVGQDTLTYEAKVAVHNEVNLDISIAGCGTLIPPDGYFIPKNCFTTVWCENQYWKTAGWPRLKEAAANLVIQTTEKGKLFKISTLPTTVYYIALNLYTFRGTVQMGP